MKILKKVVKSVPSNVVSFPKKVVPVEDVKPMSYRQMMAKEFLHSAKKGTVPVSDLLDFAQEQDKKCFDEVVDFSEVTTSFEELMGKQEVHLNRQGNEGEMKVSSLLIPLLSFSPVLVFLMPMLNTA